VLGSKGLRTALWPVPGKPSVRPSPTDGESGAVHNFRTTAYFIKGYLHRNAPRATANSIIEQQVIAQKNFSGLRFPEKKLNKSRKKLVFFD